MMRNQSASALLVVTGLLTAAVIAYALDTNTFAVEMASNKMGPGDDSSIQARPSASTSSEVTDWRLCCLCQVKIPGVHVRTANDLSVYQKLSIRLSTLQELDSLPCGLKSLDRLTEGDCLADTLFQKSAGWHKCCYDLCNEQKVSRARKRKSVKCSLDVEPQVKRSCRKSLENTNSVERCFFCDESEGNLHKVSTMSIDKKVREIATEIADTRLLAKLSEGDMFARDAMYHAACLNSLYYRHRKSSKNESSENTEFTQIHNVAFAELVDYIESSVTMETESPVFKLNDLKKMYTRRLIELSKGDIEQTPVHCSRLKENLKHVVQGLQEHKVGKEVVLSFVCNTGKALLEASKASNEIVTLMRAANIVRKEIFSQKCTFKGSLKELEDAKQTTKLDMLVDMILNGRDITKQSDSVSPSKSHSTISQLIVFNAVKTQNNDPASSVRHNLCRETMLPVYLGLLIHGKTRKKDLVDLLYDRGLCISYKRVTDISTDIANTDLDQYESTGIVCPPNLKEALYTTGNIDNIDHNPSSVFTNESFHSTALSLTQHRFGEDAQELETCIDISGHKDSTVKKPLPDVYTEIPPTIFRTTTPSPVIVYGCEPKPKDGEQTCSTKSCSVTLGDATDVAWLDHVQNRLAQNSEDVGKDENISWSAYCAGKQIHVPRPSAISALLPLFREQAHTPAMIKHGMDVLRAAIQLKNPGQVPVLTVDQPLYVLAKKIQWLWPNIYGPDKYVIMMGGLHIEMAFLRTIGDWLSGSGWINAMVMADVITPGRGEHVQKGANVSRAQWVHQIMLASLYILQTNAYASYCDTAPKPVVSFKMWQEKMTESTPQFTYWVKTMKMEMLLLKFMRAQREANFSLYKEALEEMLPWFFLLDHINYARWMSIHVEDLKQLSIASPSTHEKFCQGAFVTQKSNRKFSAMAHDQVHEQLNAVLKGDGGFIGITEKAETLKRWTVAAPELTRILSEMLVEKGDSRKHHDQCLSTQKRFYKEVNSLVQTIEDLGNPFKETSNDLMTIDTKVILDEISVKDLHFAEESGKTHYRYFLADNIMADLKSFYDPLQKNNLQLFENKRCLKASKAKDKVKTLKMDVELFSRMYISCQNRDGDLDNFFCHENYSWPPSLAENNEMRLGSKADLLDPLQKLCECTQEESPVVDCKVLDGAALVQSLDPKFAYDKITDFQDYVDKLFVPNIQKHLRDTKRLDIVWDVYRSDSLKAHTRKCRGSGESIKVSPSTTLPLANWKNFLRNEKNKTNFYHFLSKSIEHMQIEHGKVVLSTYQERVLHAMSNGSAIDTNDLEPCSHEEADYRMMLHAAHALNNGNKDVSIIATDTDVVILAIALASIYMDCCIWIAFGHAKNFRYIPAHTIAAQLGKDASWGLLFMHAVTGCDTVSAFYGVGKKSAYATWKSDTEIQLLCKKLSSAPSALSDEDISKLEKFVVTLYSKTTPAVTVNEARKYMFSYQSKQIERIPPTRSALVQHLLRAAYQGGHVWGQMLVKDPPLPSLSKWGWVKNDDTWYPNWTTLLEASEACRELIKCNCKASCRGRCKCLKANLSCTQLCFCGGKCDK